MKKCFLCKKYKPGVTHEKGNTMKNISSTWYIKQVVSYLMTIASPRAQAYAVRKCWNKIGLGTDDRLKKCGECGNTSDYSKIWAQEHPEDVATELLHYFSNFDVKKGRHAMKVSAIFADKWRSLEESLPIRGVDVLILCENGEMFVGSLCNVLSCDYLHYNSRSHGPTELTDATHWMNISGPVQQL